MMWWIPAMILSGGTGLLILTAVRSATPLPQWIFRTIIPIRIVTASQTGRMMMMMATALSTPLTIA
ncbi:MAG: hypothetical protein DRH34_10550 [Deltaproteobacteria bacterium]|nr:MAG: hypothetical protein DRH34_10550 [Deltaproteobacteria bacterium]